MHHLFGKYITKHLALWAAMIMCSALLVGCGLGANYLHPDRESNLEIQDYRDAFAEREIEEDTAADEKQRMAGIPKLQPYISAESSFENTKPMPLVSISVNESVPLKDILFELAKQADYDIELDPRIVGSIIFTARERPLDKVIDRITEMSGLRYSIIDDVLRIEIDTPYSKNYKIDYINYIRENSGSVKNDVSVVSGDGADTGSSYESSSESTADFWGELESNLSKILDRTYMGNLRTDSNPAMGGAQASSDDANFNVQSLPTGGSGGQSLALPNATFSINKQVGIISIYANKRTHGEAQEYLTELRRSSMAQVLIEAKILEVSLSDEFATGIDWNATDIFAGELGLAYGSQGNINTGASGDNLRFGDVLDSTITSTASTNFVMGFVGNNFKSVIQAITTFGTVRALASPRLTVLNNQSALLNIANNTVYFDIDIETTVDEGTRETDVDSSIRNVPEGILVNVQPAIDLNNQTISMAVRPTITKVGEFIQDPAVTFAAQTAGVNVTTRGVPEVSVQEIDSIIQMRSGQPIVMGGLLQDRVQSSQNGVPVLSEVPMLGSLFRSQNDTISKTELVILLKATIIEPHETIHDTDRDLYRTFATDRRPFKL